MMTGLLSRRTSAKQHGYAGNWAAATWAFRDRAAEEKLNAHIVKSATNQIDQVTPLFGNDISEIFLQKAVAFCSIHPHGGPTCRC